MNLSQQLAKHLRDVHFGGNWTCSNLKDVLESVTWNEAVTQVHSFNTIAKLVYHMNYFVSVVIKVLEGGPLEGNDKYSFDLPPVNSEEEWNNLLQKTLSDAKIFAALIEQLPEEKLNETFVDQKYGSYFRNIQGIIEHIHYHLGQIVVIKKLIQLTKTVAQ
jgi:hypothetical protein